MKVTECGRFEWKQHQHRDWWLIRLTAGPIDILYFIIILLLKCVNAKEISQKGESCTSLTLHRFCSSVYSDALHQCGLPSDIHLHRRTHLCSRCILRPQVLLLLPGMSRLTLAHSLVQPESYSPVTENHVILVNETSNRVCPLPLTCGDKRGKDGQQRDKEKNDRRLHRTPEQPSQS